MTNVMGIVRDRHLAFRLERLPVLLWVSGLLCPTWSLDQVGDVYVSGIEAHPVRRLFAAC